MQGHHGHAWHHPSNEANRQKRAALRPSQPPAPTTGNSDLLEGLKSFGHRPARSVCALSADEKHPTHHPPPTATTRRGPRASIRRQTGEDGCFLFLSMVWMYVS